MGYSPTYRDVETGERSRCSCVGFLGVCMAMMIFAIVISIPGLLGGSIIFAGGLLGFVPFSVILFGPFVICALAIKLASEHRDESETGNLQ